MLTKEFNALSLADKNKLVFSKGKFINVFNDNTLQKGFFFTLIDLKIDVIYDKARNRLLDIIAWDDIKDRVKML